MLPDDESHDRLLALYRSRVAGYTDVADGFSQRWSDWCRRLLQYGGDLVVPPLYPEHDLDELLRDACQHPAASRVALGDDNACHANVAMLWTDGAVAAIGTGYALSEDGLWRQHSWGVDADGDGTAVETTFERQAYIGGTLAAVPALKFAITNARTHVKAAVKAPGPRARELTAIVVEARRQHAGIEPG